MTVVGGVKSVNFLLVCHFGHVLFLPWFPIIVSYRYQAFLSAPLSFVSTRKAACSALILGDVKLHGYVMWLRLRKEASN